MLATGPNCTMQSPHRDFYHSKDLETRASESSIDRGCAHPAYFSIVTGSFVIPIWLLHGSHNYVFYTLAELKMLSKREKLRLLYIPPYSVLIVRGDVLHSCAGSKECMGAICERLHMYIWRDGIALADAINVAPYFEVNKKDMDEDWKKLVVYFSAL